jgi:hypothetical protein
MMAAVAIQTMAADFTYRYLVVKTSDGTEVSLDADNLRLTFANGQLVTNNNVGSQTFNLALLASMQFSDTEGISGISPTLSVADGRIEVYTLSGMYVGTFDTASSLNTQLRSGVYVVKQNNKSTKIIVK